MVQGSKYNYLVMFTNMVINKIPIRVLRHSCYRALGMKIGQTSEIDRRTEIINPKNISVDEHTRIGWFCWLNGNGGLEIGNNVNISSYAKFETGSHDPLSSDFKTVLGKITVGDYAWIATNALVLGGVNIGEGAVVAAGAVVTKDIPPYEVWGGGYRLRRLVSAAGSLIMR